jgi:hypothetical protein
MEGLDALQKMIMASSWEPNPVVQKADNLLTELPQLHFSKRELCLNTALLVVMEMCIIMCTVLEN